jgi:hypothetical protein
MLATTAATRTMTTTMLSPRLEAANRCATTILFRVVLHTVVQLVAMTECLKQLCVLLSVVYSADVLLTATDDFDDDDDGDGDDDDGLATRGDVGRMLLTNSPELDFCSISLDDDDFLSLLCAAVVRDVRRTSNNLRAVGTRLRRRRR